MHNTNHFQTISNIDLRYEIVGKSLDLWHYAWLFYPARNGIVNKQVLPRVQASHKMYSCLYLTCSLTFSSWTRQAEFGAVAHADLLWCCQLQLILCRISSGTILCPPQIQTNCSSSKYLGCRREGNGIPADFQRTAWKWEQAQNGLKATIVGVSCQVLVALTNLFWWKRAA